MMLLNISPIILEAVIGGLSFVIALLWTHGPFWLQMVFIAVPMLFEFLCFIVILFYQDLLTPEYGITQSVVHSLIYSIAFFVEFIGDIAPNGSDMPFILLLIAKLFIVLASTYYWQRMSHKQDVYFLPIGPIVGAVLMSVLYVKSANVAACVITGSLSQVLFNVFICPPKPTKSELIKKRL